MSVTETILQSFTFAFHTTKVIQLYGLTKLFPLNVINKMNFFQSATKTILSRWYFSQKCILFKHTP